ncbi:surface antigen [Elusimicrobium simillimum]|uniref:CHAP domain-containing protein n=1 Tax=Elusimicrobium simillimum TaxID=3143438 RepID=UPI003C7004DF
MKKIILLTVLIIIVLCVCVWIFKNFNLNRNHKPGDIVDNLDGVNVYYNGGVSHTEGRNLTADGYNLGIKYQCVEFIKRYYYEHYNHKMPDTYGNAKDFFRKGIKEMKLNDARGLIQLHNPGGVKPQKGDIVVFSPTIFNRFGHVAIISEVTDSTIQIVQQNPGPFGASREVFPLEHKDNKWKIKNRRIMGSLRMP